MKSIEIKNILAAFAAEHDDSIINAVIEIEKDAAGITASCTTENYHYVVFFAMINGIRTPEEDYYQAFAG